MRQQWEYLELWLPIQDNIARLNKLGSQGWELVCILKQLYVFKRQAFPQHDGGESQEKFDPWWPRLEGRQ